MDTPVIYRVTLEIELDEPLQDAEEKSAICAAIESIIEGDAFHEAMAAGVDLHIGVAQVLALEDRTLFLRILKRLVELDFERDVIYYRRSHFPISSIATTRRRTMGVNRESGREPLG
jgi:hypothetical protein